MGDLVDAQHINHINSIHLFLINLSCIMHVLFTPGLHAEHPQMNIRAPSVGTVMIVCIAKAASQPTDAQNPCINTTNRA